jgi:hypothetical protein
MAFERGAEGSASRASAAEDGLDLGEGHDLQVFGFRQSAAEVGEAHQARDVEQGPGGLGKGELPVASSLNFLAGMDPDGL